jgi:hypothetical protein
MFYAPRQPQLTSAIPTLVIPARYGESYVVWVRVPVRTTLKIYAVSQWCPSVCNESFLFLSSVHFASYSSETCLSRSCFSVVFAFLEDLRLSLSTAGLLFSLPLLRPDRHCPFPPGSQLIHCVFRPGSCFSFGWAFVLSCGPET